MFADCIFQGIFFLLLDVLSDSLHYFWNLYTYPHNRIDQFIKKKQVMKIVIRAPTNNKINTVTSKWKVALSFLLFMLQFESMQRQYTCSITIRQLFSLMLKVMLFFLSLWCVNKKREERRGRWVRGNGNEMWGNRGNVSGMEVKGGLFSGLPVHLGTTTQWQQC